MHIQGESEDCKGSFKFEEVDFSPKALSDASAKELWEKWGLDQNSYIKRLSFDEFFSEEQKDVFFKDLFSSEIARKALGISTGRNNSWTSVGPLTSYTATDLTATVTNLDFFSKINDLEDPAVVRDKGALVKCFDEFVDGVPLSDELRKMLVMEESEHFEEFSEEERREFIFHIFLRVCMGGGMCQYEDDIRPYLETVKVNYPPSHPKDHSPLSPSTTPARLGDAARFVFQGLYKDLVSVQKNPSTKALEVTSFVYQLEEAEGEFGSLFPDCASRQHSFCYLVVEPTKRHVTIWYLSHMTLF